MIVHKALIDQEQLAHAIEEVERNLAPKVLRIRYAFDEDWTGDPAIFFKITLSEDASRRDQLLKMTKAVSSAIEEQLQPLDQWGLLHYFNFRSQSEQAQLNDPAWA